MTGGAGGGSNIRHGGKDIGADAPDERHVERVWQAARGMAVEHDLIAEDQPQTLPEKVAQALNIGHSYPRPRNVACFAERCGQQWSLGTGASAAFVPSARDKR